MNSSKAKFLTTGYTQVGEGRAAVGYAMIAPEPPGVDKRDAGMARPEARIPYFNSIATGSTNRVGMHHIRSCRHIPQTGVRRMISAMTQASSRWQRQREFIAAPIQVKRLMMIKYLAKPDTHAVAKFAGFETGAQRLTCERKHFLKANAFG